VNNLSEGEGSMIFKGGNKYSGSFRKGLMHGKGKYEWISQGVVYSGDFKNNSITGTGNSFIDGDDSNSQGRYDWPDGTYYEGELIEGIRNGRGKFVGNFGEYEGDWRQGAKHGSGILRYKSSESKSSGEILTMI
jgi:hypothetical protein